MEGAPASGVKASGVEQRNLQALIIACGLLGLVGFVSLRILVAVGMWFLNLW